MKIAPIAPVSLMHRYEFQKASIHMAIASFIIEDTAKGEKGYPTYSHAYKDLSAQGKHVILDNGVWETGVSCSDKQLRTIADIIDATEIVIPDKMKDYAETMLLADKFLFNDVKKGNYKQRRYMFVPQGADWWEWLQCYEAGIKAFGRHIHTIGIPKWLGRLTPDSIYGRGVLLESPDMKFYARFDYHLLGVNSFMELDYMRLHSPQYLMMHIRSADTSLPYVMAQIPYTDGTRTPISGSVESTKEQLTSKRLPRFFEREVDNFDNRALQQNMELLDIFDGHPLGYRKAKTSFEGGNK